MKSLTHLIIRDHVKAWTPNALGINVEVQDHAMKSNLWDWLADSGVSCVREFHPEQLLRIEDTKAGDWGKIDTEADYHHFREQVKAEPKGGLIKWDRYAYDKHVPWMGVPDEIIDRVNAIQAKPLFSLGYGTTHFPRPLIKDIEARAMPDTDGIDWEAALSAYELYFTMIYHYATAYGGTDFMMVNEPENRNGWFYLPDDLAEMGWGELFWYSGAEVNERYCDILATQYEMLSRIARDAIEDVKTLLEQDQANKLRLIGPVTVLWDVLWERAGQYLDVLDFHHYHPKLDSFKQLYEAASSRAEKLGKPVAMSEFNRYSGGIEIGRMLFDINESLETAALMMDVLELNTHAAGAFDFATLYLLHFPSTHRNFKHLLYGDMNTVDWSGQDRPLWNRGKVNDNFGEEAWYPSFEELQIRHATPAYYCFRMLMRCGRDIEGKPQAGEVLGSGMVNPSTSGPEDIDAQLKSLVVRQSGWLLINLLNPSDKPAKHVELDLSEIEGQYKSAVVRLTNTKHTDRAIDQWQISEGIKPIKVPAKSMVQVILTEDDLSKMEDFELTEVCLTPGSLVDGLSLYETTRLDVHAKLGNRRVRVNDINLKLVAETEDLYRTEDTGLVQKIRNSDYKQSVEIVTCGGTKLDSLTL